MNCPYGYYQNSIFQLMLCPTLEEVKKMKSRICLYLCEFLSDFNAYTLLLKNFMCSLRICENEVDQLHFEVGKLHFSSQFWAKNIFFKKKLTIFGCIFVKTKIWSKLTPNSTQTFNTHRMT